MNPFRWSFRASFAFLALVCIGLLSFAYYAQFKLGMEPCPLCILQRVAFIAFAIVVLILAFGSVLAMGLPISVALGGVGVGGGIVAVVPGRLTLCVWSPALDPQGNSTHYLLGDSADDAENTTRGDR